MEEKNKDTTFKQFLKADGMSEEHLLRLQLWNDGIIEEINDQIPSKDEIIKMYQEKHCNDSMHDDD